MSMVNFSLFAAGETLATTFPYMWTGLGIIIGCLVLYCLFRWISNVSSKYNAQFIQSMVDDIAKWLGQEGLMNKDEAQAELQRVFQGSPSPEFLKQLLRLECKFVQTAPSRCEQTTTMVFRKGDKIQETTFSRSVDWDFLPSAIRQEFILNNPKEITYDFLKSQKKG